MQLTNEQISKLGLGIAPIDARTEIIINSGIEWLEENTTIDITDIDKIPNGAKLFLIQFFDLQMLKKGVSSQSIEGLSVSFDTSGNIDLWKIAEELLGAENVKSRVKFVPATKKWL